MELDHDIVVEDFKSASKVFGKVLAETPHGTGG